MHANLFDRYPSGNSLTHRLDPRVKVVIVLLFILSVVLLPDGSWLAFGLAFGFVLLANTLSRLGLAYSLKRSLIALPFALVAVTTLFSIPGEPLATLSLGPWQLIISDAGVLRFFSIVTRMWLSVQVAVMLVATTSFPDLLHAMRHLHMPAIIVAIISFMYRYLFVLSDEAMRMLRAREARSASLIRTGNRSIVWQARVAGNMAGQLFLRSLERSDQIYHAMLARGYTGQLLTLNPHELQRSDWAIGAVVLVFLLILQITARL